ncbi:ATP-dependent Clp protease ATP-binding subunit [Thiospirochaeta perfilievii]|uniref:ATP-dependent Clp protease ATP-binding subunit n=1 Tax=Thiospirochaeta perfilievii TaxID=252967 RepID=A0A5C1QA44_9SPIO|nr:ATP-dependent Clp protease ATP-binding subunit [Thiospirochaeta perfilievii]QEN03789.1 ATP-dependent Clp protease ATP-binding subunit [Thiospirochaeta perfilievii]
MIRGFTPEFQKIISVTVQKIGKDNNSVKIEPEHVILGLIDDVECLAYKALSAMSVDIDDMKSEILDSIKKDDKDVFIAGEIPQSRRTKWLLESATKEARNFNRDLVGTEHILFAAITEVGSQANKYITSIKLNLDILRRVIFELNKKKERLSGFTSSIFKDTTTVTEVEKSSSLKDFCIDLTQRAKNGLIDPVLGREFEIERIVRILSRRNKNNPVLIGEPGVGKTAIIEGLASRIVNGEVPHKFLNKKILTLDIASMIAGTKYRGEFEGRFKKLIKEIVKSGDIILFIDELHSIVGAGGAEGAIDASTILKPSLSRGEIRCIGATTLDEYKKHIEKDTALDRRFQQVYVEEPNFENSVAIIRGVISKYESHHNVKYSDAALVSAVSLADRYITDKFQPDKTIDLIDEAGAVKSLQVTKQPEELLSLEFRVDELVKEKSLLVKNQNYEKAARIRDEVISIRQEIDELKSSWQSSLVNQVSEVTQDDIYDLISRITGIPSIKFATDEKVKLLELDSYLKERVVGQDEAVNAITASVRRARAGISSPNRPLGSFIFLGPTGVGKTLLAKTLATFLFGDEKSLIRVDMSDYMEKHNVSRLVGAPPGYVGYEEGGFLTDKIRRKPYSVILLDEIEKAHADVFNLLLQILEEGELQDSSGRTISFKNCVVIMTSNAGARDIVNVNKFGFVSQSGEQDQKSIKSSALGELKRIFRPEFLNRIDETIVFKALNHENLKQILDISLKELVDRLKAMDISLDITSSAKLFLLDEKHYDKSYGARPIRRIILNQLEDPLALEILLGKLDQGAHVSVELKEENLVFNYGG